MSKADYVLNGFIIEIGYRSEKQLLNISENYMDKMKELLSKKGGVDENK